MTQPLATAGAFRALMRVRLACLYAVVAVASELHVVVLDASGISLPDAGVVTPLLITAWGPCILAILWLNLAVDSPAGRPVLDVGARHLWGALLLSSLTFSEWGHALANNRAPDFSLILSLVWIALLYVTLESFSSMPRAADQVVAAIVVCSAVGSLVIVATVVTSASHIGIAQFLRTPQRLDISGVNSFAYLGAMASLLCLQRLLLGRLPISHRWLWAIGFLVNAAAVIVLKSRGAWLLLLVLGLLFLLTSYVRSRAVIALAGVAIFSVIAASATGHLSVHVLDDVLSLGRGLNPALELESRGLHSEKISRVSALMRHDMVLTTADVVQENTLFGVGLADFLLRRSAGHSVHGLWLLLAGAYGLVGVALVAGFFLSTAARPSDTTQMPIFVVAIASIGMASMLLGNPPFWFALCLGLLFLTARPSKACVEH